MQIRKCNKKPTLTKRQKKRINGNNDMVQRIINQGVKHCENYFGRNPVYRNIAKIGQPENFVKFSSGIPFVSVRRA